MGKRIILDDSYIKGLPLTTNRLEVIWEREAFFRRYSIVTYHATGQEHRNLAYEHLADAPCLSVAGIRARWGDGRPPSVRFFVLTLRGGERDVIGGLRAHDDVAAAVTDLSELDDRLQKRTVASLAINSLGMKKGGSMMYSNGTLLVCDDRNFGTRKSRHELVCLQIGVNEFMNLTASTKTFTHPSSERELMKCRSCVFQVCGDIDGEFWSGQAVRPVTLRNAGGGEHDLKRLFVLGKTCADSRNRVPYWPYSPQEYTHGKLFVIRQVAESVNREFGGILELRFTDYPVLHYDECRTGDSMLALLRDCLDGKSVSFEDPFGTEASRALTAHFRETALRITDGRLSFPATPAQADIVIRLCEPREEDYDHTLYAKSGERESRKGHALQHIVLDAGGPEDIGESTVRRILIEALVKDSLARGRMPAALADLIRGWEFTRYRINRGDVHGASLRVGDDGAIGIDRHGLSPDGTGEDYESFVSGKLGFGDADAIRGSRDYMAMSKGGNVYLIIDTDEIPILDTALLDAGYDRVVHEGEPLSMFKRKGVVHEYLRGYIGFHMWRTEGLDGTPMTAYSYISGTNSETLKITNGTRMDRMPRARRIFVLRAADPQSVESDIMETVRMLKFGFGRWGEMMTYPFPFKFLQEYLDDAAETLYSLHWRDITGKKEL